MNYIIKERVQFMEVREARDITLNRPRAIYKFMQVEAGIDRECIWVLHLNSKLKLIEKELVSMGTLNRTHAHPREIFKKAIINSSDSIIVVHNHPSGDINPSREDMTVAQRLRKAGEILGIEVRDFIVISTKGFCSFAEEGIF